MSRVQLAPRVARAAKASRGGARAVARGGRAARPTAARQRWEQEASAAAVAAATSRRGAVRGLTRAPTAAVPARAGAGAPLPGPTRRRLEHAFAADLAAVRLHTDESAAALARELDARAFAAGRHVFLDLPAHDVTSERGFALLAHEIAHVLQQSAILRAGVLTVEDRAGTAAVQRAPDLLAELIKENVLLTIAWPFASVKKIYTDAFGATGPVATELAAIASLLGADDLDTAPATTKAAIAARVLTPKVVATPRAATALFAALPPGAKGLYLDVLSALGLFEEAATLQDLHKREVPTRLRSAGFYRHYRATRSSAWIEPRLASFKELRDFFPGNLIDAYRIHLFGAEMKVPLQGPGKLLAAALLVINRQIRGTTPGNEFDVVAAATLVHYDGRRKDLEGDREAAVQAKLKDQPGRWISTDMEAVAKDAATGVAAWLPAKEPEYDRLSATFSPKLKALAERAVAYWGLVSAGFEAVRTQSASTVLPPVGDLAKLNAVARTVGTHKDTARVDREIAAAATAVLADAKTPPAPATVRAGRKTARTRLEQLRASLGHATVKLARSHKTVDELSEAGLRLGIAVNLLRFTELLLGRYDADVDAGWRKRNLLDYWISERLRFSDFWASWPDRLGMTATAAVVSAFRTPKRGELAMLGTWTPNPLSDRKVTDDLDNTELVQLIGTGLSVGQIDRFGQALYYEALTRTLKELLVARGKDLSADAEPILDEATRTTEAAHLRPHSYLMDQVYWYLGSEAKTTETTPRALQLFDLILNHPRMDELKVPDTSWPVASASPSRHAFYGASTVVVWVLPHLDALVAELQREPLLDQRARAQWKAVHGTDAPTLMPWKDWLYALGEATTALKAAGEGDKDKGVAPDPAKAKEQQDLEALVIGRIRARYTAALTAAELQGRLATTHARLVAIQNYFLPQLRAFDRYHLSRFEKSRALSENFSTFAANVWPTRDAVPQTATLVIELAPSILSAFGDEGGLLGTGVIHMYQVLRWLAPLVAGALDAWDTPAVRAEILGISFLTEPVLQVAVGGLRTLLGTVTTAAGGERSGTGLVGRVEEMRSRSRMRGDAAAGQIWLPGWHSTFKTGDDQQFLYGGKYWNLKQVHRSFHWLPPVPLDDLGVPWPRPTSAGSSLLFGADGKTPISRAGPLLTLQVVDYKTFDVTDQVIDGTPAGDRQLDQLSEAVVVNDIAEQLKALGETMEKAAEVVMEILELIPGLGQGMMALRFVQGVASFLLSEDFKELLALFQEDGVGAIGKLLDKVATLFEPEKLLLWLLFRSQKLPFTAPAAGKPKTDKRAQYAKSSGKFSAIGRAVRNVLGFGINLTKSIERLRARAQGPARGLRLWVLEHPTAALILDIITDTVLPAAQFTMQVLAEHARDDATPGADVASSLMESASESITGILQGAADAVATLSFLELPEEIIPMDAVVDFLLDQVIQRLGAKFRVALSVARAGLRELGVWNKITAAIADGFKSVGGDPNKFYQDEIKAKLQPYLDDIRAALVQGLSSFFDQFPFVKELAKAPAAPQSDKVGLDFQGDEFPVSQPALSEDAGARSIVAGPLPAPAGGQALAPALRARHEPSFATDLSHVRLHTGGDAAAVTSRFGADGLTTGSHVYLRPGLDATSGAGERILRHELSHVVDQSAPRPLGGRHDARPVVGAPGRGLIWDPASEARAARAAQSASGAVSPRGAAPAGVQPSLSLTAKFLTDFVKELKSPERLQKQASRLAELRKTKPDFSKDPKGQAIATALATALPKAFADPKVFVLAKPFDKVRAQLLAYLKGGDLGKVITEAVPLLVMRARSTIKLKKKAGRDATDAALVLPSLLDVEVSEFLYGETGLAVQLRLNQVKDADLDHRDAVDPNHPIKSIELVYLHVPFMHGEDGKKLLVTAAAATWPSIKDAGEQAFLVGIAGLLIARLGPRPDIWDSTAFKFHAATRRRIEEQKGSLQKVVKAKHWPTPAQYTATDVTAVPDGSNSAGKAVKGADVADIGLRLGTYATWGPKGSHGSPDRDAHHITQYVFFQYLRNAKLLKPFPTAAASKRALFGVKPATGPVAKIEAIGGNAHKTIDVQGYEDGRGGAMATIYLARNTHRADVHLHGESADDDPSARDSQGGTVDNLFRAGVRAALSPKGGADVLDDKAALTAIAAAPSATTKVKTPLGSYSQADLNLAVFSAARHLYVEMASEMNPKLEQAMTAHEVAYYNLVAERRKLTDRLPASAIAPVFKAVVERNRKVIGADAGVDP